MAVGLGGRLAQAGLVEPSPSGLRASGSAHLCSTVSLLLPFSLTLLFHPWRRRLGERQRHSSRLSPALCRRRVHPPGMPRPPLLFPCAVRDGAPQTLTKLSVFGSESSYNILSYLLTWMSYAGSVPGSSNNCCFLC